MKSILSIKISILLMTLLCLSSFSLSAQEKKNRFYYGGNLGAQFGTFTYFDISPLVGYKLTDRVSVGVGATYIYYSEKRIDFSTSIYGGRVFNRFLITDNIFTHIEYEVLSREIIDFNNNRRRIEIGSLLAGGGLRQRLGENSSVQMSALWNLNQTIYSPYVNPIIRIGFSMGF